VLLLIALFSMLTTGEARVREEFPSGETFDDCWRCIFYRPNTVPVAQPTVLKQDV